MFFYVVAAVAGLMLGGRSKPLSRQQKMKMLGPNTGNHYAVEDIIDANVVVVHAGDGTVVVFDREKSGKLVYRQARGNMGTVELVKKDFLPPEPKTYQGERVADVAN